jgi:hypothetical protein
MDFSKVGQDVLNAATRAAGASWNDIQHDFVSDLNTVLQTAAEIEAKLLAGRLSQAEAEDLLKDQTRISFVLTQEAIVSGKVVAQNAINAAIDVLWAAVKTAAKIA